MAVAVATPTRGPIGYRLQDKEGRANGIKLDGGGLDGRELRQEVLVLHYVAVPTTLVKSHCQFGTARSALHGTSVYLSGMMRLCRHEVSPKLRRSKRTSSRA